MDMSKTGKRAEPSDAQIARHLRAANAIAQRALDAGHHPFGALLVGPDHESVWLEQGNVDGVNQWGRTKDLTVVGMGASTLDEYLRVAAAEQGRTLRADPEPEKGFYYRSDHFNFAKQGVPALDPDAGIDYIGRSPEYGKTKRDEYTDVDYHAPSDQVKADWDLSGALDDAQLFFAVGYRVANADAFPEWAAGNEFKATRDESLKPLAH